MKQLEIPFEFKKEENKAIFGGCRSYNSNKWVILDDAKSLRKRDKHIMVFNTESMTIILNGNSVRYAANDDETLKPSMHNYLLLASYLKKTCYRFNKKLSTIEKIPK